MDKVPYDLSSAFILRLFSLFESRILPGTERLPRHTGTTRCFVLSTFLPGPTFQGFDQIPEGQLPVEGLGLDAVEAGLLHCQTKLLDPGKVPSERHYFDR
jgi:hypothetical protein